MADYVFRQQRHPVNSFVMFLGGCGKQINSLPANYKNCRHSPQLNGAKDQAISIESQRKTKILQKHGCFHCCMVNQWFMITTHAFAFYRGNRFVFEANVMTPSAVSVCFDLIDSVTAVLRNWSCCSHREYQPKSILDQHDY